MPVEEESMRVREIIQGDHIFLEIVEELPEKPKDDEEKTSSVWIGELVPDCYGKI
ncbi:MAG: hypothetical protein HY815_26905 [Candidatus Riflebacteria bacterium]|nr:hypothetical protein [Candidatus Riflebacteria bacterium]